MYLAFEDHHHLQPRSLQSSTRGYEAQILLNATGYATAKKWDLLEKQIRHFLTENVKNNLETLEFQR